MSTKDGGPAFPVPFVYDPDRGECGAYVDGEDAGAPTGMTLRDWFAGQALAALLADHEREWFPDFDDVVEDPDGRWMLNPDTKVVYPIPVSYTPSKSHVRVRSINTWRERLAREAYRIADAMLAARNTHT